MLGTQFWSCTFRTKYRAFFLRRQNNLSARTDHMNELTTSSMQWIFWIKLTLHEKPYFPSPRILWKAQKDQINIIFPSTLRMKNDCVSHNWKVQNKNFSVISIYHLSSTFWLKQISYFPSRKSSKHKLFSNQQISSFHQLFGSKKVLFFHLRKVQNKNFSVIS